MLEPPNKLFPLFFLLGFGLILPWNVFLNFIALFSQNFPPGNRYPFLCPLAFNSPQLAAQLLFLGLGRRIPPSILLTSGFICQSILLACLPLLAHYLTLTLLLNFFSGLSTAIVESALFGACANFSAKDSKLTVRAAFMGEGMAALIANLIQIILNADPPSTVQAQENLTLGYCIAAAFVTGLCALLAPYALHLGGGAAREDQRVHQDGALSKPLLLELITEARVQEEMEKPKLELAGDPTPALLPVLSRAFRVLKSCWTTCCAVFFAMFFSFLVFPGEVSNSPFVGRDSGYFTTHQPMWTLILYLTFNLGDLVGRWAAGVEAISPKSGVGILLYSLSRATLPLLFYALAVARRHEVGSLQGGEGAPLALNVGIVVLCVTHGATNGHAATLAMMHGPTAVAPEDRGVAAVLHVLMLITGLWAGSAAGLVFAD